MKSIFIAAVLTTLVAAVPPPPVDSAQPDADLADLADASSQVAEHGPCYKQCRNHCFKIWSPMIIWPITWPIVIAHCRRKCKKECAYEEDGYGDVAFDFASIVGADGSLNATGLEEEEKQELKNLDMEMLD